MLSYGGSALLPIPVQPAWLSFIAFIQYGTSVWDSGSQSRLVKQQNHLMVLKKICRV